MMSEQEIADWEKIRAEGFSHYLGRAAIRAWIGIFLVGTVLVTAHIYFGYKNAAAVAIFVTLAFGNAGRLRVAWSRKESAYRFTMVKREVDTLLTNRGHSKQIALEGLVRNKGDAGHTPFGKH